MALFRRLFLLLFIGGVLWLTAWRVLAQTDEPIPCEAVYTVQAGDWLSKIAEKYYDNLLTYRAIAFATNKQNEGDFAFVTDYDLIEPGWQLCIPPAEAAADILASLPPPPTASPTPTATASPTPAVTPTPSTTTSTRFAEQLFSGLVKGDPGVEDQIDWENFFILGQDFGSAYRELSPADQALNRTTFIQSFAGAFQQAGGDETVLTGYQSLNQDQNSIQVMADLGDNQLVIFTLSAGDEPQLQALSVRDDPPSPLPEYPLHLGNTWVYSTTHYDTIGTERITATYIITRSVIERFDLPPYATVRIREDRQVLTATTGLDWLAENEGYLGGLDRQFDTWYIIDGTQLYEQPELNPETAAAEGWLRYQFPLKAGALWYSDPQQRAQFTNLNTGPTSGKTSVIATGAQRTPAGEWLNCFELSTFYNSGGPLEWFCAGVGVVSTKYDHVGTPFGYQSILLDYNLR